MTQATTPIHATTPQLIKATGAALLAAAAILLTTVLPAEYGLDPTGIGKALGLTALSSTAESAEAPAVTAAPAATASVTQSVTQSESPFQNGEMSLVLQANEGAEIKALMRAGDAFVFSWSTDGGPVNFDMHGEKPNAGDEFSSYWKDRAKTSGHGSFTAPFDGSHGWYGTNRSTEPVTVTVKLSGYFEKLYRPG